MKLHAGDHVCSVYETDEQLVATVAGFLADGLTRGERCWYVPHGGEVSAIRSAMERRGIDVAAASRQTALNLLDANETYTVHAGFDPEQTMRVFSNAIEESLNDGFKGFRAAAEMSWALDVDNGGESLVAYEALLRVLFSTARATGLCMYDRRRMPWQVLNGALFTHPIIGVSGAFERNPLYDPSVLSLSDVDRSSKRPIPRSTRVSARPTGQASAKHRR